MLEGDFTEEEIWQALVDLCGDRSPSSDGFPIQFYCFCWLFMKQDILKVFKSFASSGFLEWRLNTTFITLIPKHHGANSISYYWPIALLSGCYKLVAKVLANRIKPLLSLLVSDFQGAAVEGRQIQDLSLMANELLDSILTSKEGGLVFKLDFLKAFNCISWSFLDRVLESMGFGSKWRSWLLTCWKTTSFSVLFNGSPG